MLSGLVKDMTNIDFGFTRSKVKVTRVIFVNMVSTHFLENYLSQSFYIKHADWSWWRHGPIHIEVTKSNVKFRRITFVQKIPLIILRTVSHRAFIFHTL